MHKTNYRYRDLIIAALRLLEALLRFYDDWHFW
jgi:hypothetical protein